MWLGPAKIARLPTPSPLLPRVLRYSGAGRAVTAPRALEFARQSADAAAEMRASHRRAKIRWRQFTQLRFTDGQRQTGIATRHRVAHAVAFAGVEKQSLVRLGDSLIMAKMAHIDAAIWKHYLCGGRAPFVTLVPTAALAAHVSDG